MTGEFKLYRPEQFSDLLLDLNQGFRDQNAAIVVLDKPLEEKQARVFAEMPEVILFAVLNDAWPHELPSYLAGSITNLNDERQLLWALESAKRYLELRHHNRLLKFKLSVEKEKRRLLTENALELSEEKNPQVLFEKTLASLRKIIGAEGASLFIFDEKQQLLRFRHVQNEALPTNEWKEFSVPLDEKSIAGACAFRKSLIHIPDVYDIDPKESFEFNRSFDEKSGYRTRSLLSIPLLKTDRELVGVVQLINSKKAHQFQEEEIEMAQAYAAHIAVALENALLYDDIENLFEGFIHASVTAIESRDPTTSGHSERVALLTAKIAEKVSDSEAKVFKNLQFRERQLREIKYAALLHDFGKIGVPEKVLVKAKKLFPEELALIEQRFESLKLLMPDRKQEFEDLWQKIQSANEPTILVEELKENLEHYIDVNFQHEGKRICILEPHEWSKLSIRKGSLSPEERHSIESHVLHTRRFLERIPWTKPLARVTEIAAYHHERLDGTGYPEGLKENEIPFESQMMAVADVFDALTAMDRPYKKAMPFERALEILKMEANEFKLNADLVELFIQQKIFEALRNP